MTEIKRQPPRTPVTALNLMQERYYNTYSLQGCKAKNDNKVAPVVIKNARGEL